MNPLMWTGVQWWNFAAAAIALVGAASWWGDFVAAEHVATVHSCTLTTTGIINLLLGKANV